MRKILSRWTLVAVALFIFTACGSDKSVKNSEPEPVDEAFTQSLQADLDQQLRILSDSKTAEEESEQLNGLEYLAEQDRQNLIDQTADAGSAQIADDAQQIIEVLEDIAAESQSSDE